MNISKQKNLDVSFLFFFLILIFVLLYWGVNLYRKHLQESLRKAALIINWIGVQRKSIELTFLQILMLKTYTSRSFFQMVEKQEQKNVFFKLFKRKSLLECHCSSGYIPENHFVDVASLLLKYSYGWQTSLFPLFAAEMTKIIMLGSVFFLVLFYGCTF